MITVLDKTWRWLLSTHKTRQHHASKPFGANKNRMDYGHSIVELKLVPKSVICSVSETSVQSTWNVLSIPIQDSYSYTTPCLFCYFIHISRLSKGYIPKTLTHINSYLWIPEEWSGTICTFVNQGTDQRDPWSNSYSWAYVHLKGLKWHRSAIFFPITSDA